MSDKLMMTIARAINDVVLVVLKTPEILEPIAVSYTHLTLPTTPYV